MRIEAIWGRQIELRDGSPNLIYALPKNTVLPAEPAVYLFARKFGGAISPLYVGQTKNLAARIRTHLTHNLQLMRGIENEKAGSRVLLFATLQLKPGQQRQKVLKIVESVLIEQALAQEATLLNKQGTRQKSHEIQFGGRKIPRAIAPRAMRARARK